MGKIYPLILKGRTEYLELRSKYDHYGSLSIVNVKLSSM